MTLQAIDDHWRRLPYADLPPEISSITEADAFWGELLEWDDGSGGKPFEELSEFALDALLLPHSNADCERSFTKVNLCKTRIRNKLVVPTINGILLSSQAVKSSSGVCFNPSDDMRERMTAANYYALAEPKSQPLQASATWSTPNATSPPATSGNDVQADRDIDPEDMLDEEIFF